MGTLKGRIGDNVLYVKQGEQNAVKYQPNVSNPKTGGQCLQRAKFSAAGKFYTHGTQALFKFAFENKNKGESDFNAFVRENVQDAIPMSRRAISEPQYPMVNDWLMSKGSLTSLKCTGEIATSTCIATTSLPLHDASVTEIATVADLARAVVDGYNFKYGDIVTVVLIHSYLGSQSYPAIIPDVQLDAQYNWLLRQLVLSVNDVTNLSDHGFTCTVRAGQAVLSISQSASSFSTSYIGCAAILSRKTSGGLKVSTARLSVEHNTEYQQPLASVKQYAETEGYRANVIESWQNDGTVSQSTDIVLEGAITSKAGLSTGIVNIFHGPSGSVASTHMSLPFDPRQGYLVATAGQLTQAEAVSAYEVQDFHYYYYNKTLGMFVDPSMMEEGTGAALNITQADGFWRVSSLNDNGLYYAVAAWVSESGQRIDFPLVLPN